MAFRNYSVSNGLSSSEVYKVFQDSRGYMWFCSDAGVCRYDGYSFRTFTSEHGLPDNTIFDMYEDSKKRIWFFGMTKKLSYYDPATDSISAVACNDELSKTAIGSTITSLFVDAGDTLFVAINYAPSFFKIPPAKNYKTMIPVVFDHPGWQFCRFSRDRYLWGVTSDSISPSGKRVVMPRTPKKCIQVSVHEQCLQQGACYRSPQFYYGLQETSRGFALLHGGMVFFESGYVNIFRGDTLLRPYTDSLIISIYTDKEGNVWLGTTMKGVFEFRHGDFSSPPVHYLSNYSVSSIYQDNEGAYWFTTLDHGVYYTPSLLFSYYDKTSGLLGDKVYSVMQHHDSVICFTEKRYLNSISRHGVFADTTVIGLNAYNMVPESDVIFVSENLSYFYNLKTHKKRVALFKEDLHGVYTRKVWVTPHKDIYALFSRGICHFREDTPLVSPLNSRYLRATSLLVSGDTIWVGMLNGMYREIKGKAEALGNTSPLLKNRVDDIVEDDRGWLWMATKGAGVLIRKGSRIIQLLEKDGLPSNLCRTLLLDGTNVVWVGTNRGISKITLVHDTIRSIDNYNSTSGMLSDEINKMCIVGNYLYAATNKGVVKFDRTQLRPHRVPPPVYITGFWVNEKPVPVKARHVLAHDENFIRIACLGLTYRDPGMITYKYRLNGLDTSWHYTKNTTVQYTTLPPGDYMFLVYAIDHDNISSLTPCCIFFTINKPYWKTWWFITLSVLFVAACLYLLFRSRVRHIKQTEKEKTELNKKISEVELKAIRAQMNPHFIFNSINSIQHYVLTNDSDTAYRYLSKFSKLIRNVLENSKHEIITLQKEIETIELYVELEKLRFETKFTHEVYVDPTIDVLTYAISPLLIQPYVENAIWHGLMHKHTAGVLTLRFIDEQSLIRCVIEDDGIGRERSEELKKGMKGSHRSLALSLNKERLEIIGHLFHNKLKITIIDKTDASGQPAGTRVEVLIPKINFNDYDKSHYSG